MQVTIDIRDNTWVEKARTEREKQRGKHQVHRTIRQQQRAERRRRLPKTLHETNQMTKAYGRGKELNQRISIARKRREKIRQRDDRKIDLAVI